jgi:putative transposase
MKTTQFSIEQIIKILEQAEKGGQTIATLCRSYRIAEQTFYRWRKAYGPMSLNEARRFKELE